LAKALALDSSGNSALHSTGGAAARSTLDNFTQEELVKIGKIACSDNCLSLLVSSLCPSIFGQDVVKLGLLLGLLGGTARNTCTSGTDPSSTQQPPQTRSSIDLTDSHADSNPQGIRVRTDIHVLVVGDPGLGKSQMLRAAAAVAPRSVLVCGNTATTAGLTVTVRRNRGREAGAACGQLAAEKAGAPTPIAVARRRELLVAASAAALQGQRTAQPIAPSGPLGGDA
jgi:DNA helicase MCM8